MLFSYMAVTKSPIVHVFLEPCHTPIKTRSPVSLALNLCGCVTRLYPIESGRRDTT